MDKLCRGTDGFQLYVDVMQKIRSKKRQYLLVAGIKPIARGTFNNQLVSLYRSTFWCSGVRLLTDANPNFSFGKRNVCFLKF